MSIRIFGKKPAWWAGFASTRLHLRSCRHPLTSYCYSRRYRHPDGRGQTYTRCATCLRVTWRAWADL